MKNFPSFEEWVIGFFVLVIVSAIVVEMLT